MGPDVDEEDGGVGEVGGEGVGGNSGERGRIDHGKARVNRSIEFEMTITTTFVLHDVIDLVDLHIRCLDLLLRRLCFRRFKAVTPYQYNIISYHISSLPFAFPFPFLGSRITLRVGVNHHSLCSCRSAFRWWSRHYFYL